MKLCEHMKNENINNTWKYQLSILKKSQENHVSDGHTDIQTNISKYRVAPQQKKTYAKFISN